MEENEVASDDVEMVIALLLAVKLGPMLFFTVLFLIGLAMQ